MGRCGTLGKDTRPLQSFAVHAQNPDLILGSWLTTLDLTCRTIAHYNGATLVLLSWCKIDTADVLRTIRKRRGHQDQARSLHALNLFSRYVVKLD